MLFWVYIVDDLLVQRVRVVLGLCIVYDLHAHLLILGLSIFYRHALLELLELLASYLYIVLIMMVNY